MLVALPDELSLRIVAALPVPDRCRLARVCHHFARLTVDTTLWRRTAALVPGEGGSLLPRVCHSSVLHKGRLFVYGGHNPAPGSNYISDVRSDLLTFDLASGTWTTLRSTFSTPLRTEHCSVVVDGKMYITGGYSGMAGYQTDTIVIDLDKIIDGEFDPQPISARGDVPEGRSAHTCVAWNKGLYFFGGWNGIDTNNDFFKLDLVKKKWKRIKSKGAKPSARRSHCVTVIGDHMYIFGGYDGEKNCDMQLYRYSFLLKKWEVVVTVGTTPAGRSRARLVAYNNVLAIFGGWDRVNYFEDWHELNLETRTWRSVPVQFPGKGLGQHSADVYLNTVYVYGGHYESTQRASSELWTYSLGHLGRIAHEA